MFKAALLAGVQYAEGRGAVEFEATDSASDKALYVYRLLVHDKGEREDDSASTGDVVCPSVAQGASAHAVSKMQAPVQSGSASRQIASQIQLRTARETVPSKFNCGMPGRPLYSPSEVG